MKRPIVLDASAALRLYLADGPLPVGLEQAVAAAASGELLLLVPDLFWIEVTHVLLRLHRKGVISAEELSGLLKDVRALPCQTQAHGPLLAAVAQVALQHGLSGYDATYLALAQLHGARLLTADAELASKAT